MGTINSLPANWRPSTFVERGLLVPFTTPLLGQARLRPARGSNVELVFPNPAGGRGFYVVGIDGIGQLVSLTVHDRLLLDELLNVKSITPSEIRRAARKVAIQGSAGLLAAEAAGLAVRREEEHRALTNVLLLIGLAKETGGAELDLHALAQGDTEMRVHLRRYVAQVAPSFGLQAKDMLDVVEALSIAVAPVGFEAGTFESRCVRVGTELASFAAQIRSWAQLEQGQSRVAAGLLADCADMTREAAEPAIADAWKLTASVTTLIRGWLSDYPSTSRRLGTPEWLLDGWPHICELWSGVREDQRPAQRQVMDMIQGLVPLLPRNGGKWDESKGDADARLLSMRRWVRLQEDWRTGEMVCGAAILRNEAVLARAP